MQINLPTKLGDPNESPKHDLKQLVIIGANGSGKSRFGFRIEELYLDQVHRISAQKSLAFPVSVSPKSLEQARMTHYYGAYNENWDGVTFTQQKTNGRWGKKGATHLLDDFSHLLVLLYSEESEASFAAKGREEVLKDTKLDKVKELWENVLPHRELRMAAGAVFCFPRGETDKEYKAAEMSDGERVIFYLIAQVLCVPQDSIIIMDEPESHIHKSILKPLFDLIENERTDCGFVYLTHDIDFANSRYSAKKIWMKSYEGDNVWDYEFLAEDSPIPEDLYLEVLGSRKPVLFVEGNEGTSIDYSLYQHVFPEFTIKPLGSCSNVIRDVKAFNARVDFHHIQAYGLIDRDRRSPDDVSKLITKNLCVLDVAEAENLLLLESTVKQVSKYLGKDADTNFATVRQNVIKLFGSQFEAQVIIKFDDEIRKQLTRSIRKGASSIAERITNYQEAIDEVKPEELIEAIRAEFQTILDAEDYDAILRVFNLKNAMIEASKAHNLCGLKNSNEYLNQVLNILQKENEESLILKESIREKICGIELLYPETAED